MSLFMAISRFSVKPRIRRILVCDRMGSFSYCWECAGANLSSQGESPAAAWHQWWLGNGSCHPDALSDFEERIA